MLVCMISTVATGFVIKTSSVRLQSLLHLLTVERMGEKEQCREFWLPSAEKETTPELSGLKQ